MAVINTDTIQRLKRTLFYRLNARGVPVQLPFVIVTIDEDRQFYEPLPRVRLSPTGMGAEGEVEGMVYLPTAGPVPPPPPGETGVSGVFSYYGI